MVRLREWIFQRVNGAEGIPVPGPLVGAEHFERVYSDPAADGRAARFPNARVETIENAGHWVHHDQLDEFCRLVDDFLEEPTERA